MLMDFDTVEAGAATVSAIIAAGIVPAAMEMMDQLCLAGRRGLHPRRAAGRRRRRAARRGRRAAPRRRGRHRADHRASPATTACAPCASPPTTPSGRCCGRAASRRSARSPGSSRTTTSTTPSCRGRSCPAVLAKVYEIAARHDLLVLNVFHAGDGNLHPLLVYDGREPGVMERVARRRRGDRAGVGRGRRRAQRRARHRAGEARPDAADVLAPSTSPPRRRCGRRSTPTGWPTRARCCRARPAAATSTSPGGARGRVDLTAFADEVGDAGPGHDRRAGDAGRAGRRRAHGAARRPGSTGSSRPR